MCVSHEQIMIRQVRIQDNICNFEGIVTRKQKKWDECYNRVETNNSKKLYWCYRMVKSQRGVQYEWQGKAYSHFRYTGPALSTV